MNLKEIKEMITLMNENDLTELELEREGLKIRLRRGSGGCEDSGMIVERYRPQQIASQSLPQEGSIPAQQPEGKDYAEVKSPMVGTFYRAPSPEAEPFVQVGQDVEIGQVLCIIEAMKLMNEIKSEVKGRIKEVLVENADPIEFGQPLFKIEAV